MINFNSLKNKYLALSLPVKATLWFAMCQFFQKGIGMITVPVFTRMLSTTEYGNACSFMSCADVLMPLITLSAWRSILNLFSKGKNQDEVLSSIIGLSITIASVICLSLYLLKPILLPISGLTNELYASMIVYCFAQNIFYAWSTKMQYNYQYKILVVVSLIYSVFSAFGGILFVVLFQRTAESKLYPQIISLLVIALCIIFNQFKKKHISFNREIWFYALQFAIPLIPHYLSEVVLNSSDRIMINNMCSASDVAVYSVAYSVGSLINLVANVINGAFVSYQYHKIQEKDYKKLANSTNIVIAFIAFCLCALMMFGQEIVLIFGGAKYIDGASVIIPISLGVFFSFVFQIFARVQEYYEQKYTIVVASIACAVLNIVLNYVFINIYGYKAAAYTTFVCYFVFCILHYLFYKKTCMNNIGQEIYDIKGILTISVGLIILAPIINAISYNYLIKYILLVVSMFFILTQRKKILSFLKEMKS